MTARITASDDHTDFLSVREIGDLLTERDVSSSEFWEHALGGDMAPLPREDVERCIAEMGED